MSSRGYRVVAVFLSSVFVIATSGGCRKWQAQVFGGEEIVISCQEAPAMPTTSPVAKSEETKEPEWLWHDDDVDLARCVRRDLLDFETSLVGDGGGFDDRTLEVKVRSGETLKIFGQGRSTFCRRGDRLYFADYSAIASGCVIVAYDLLNGKEIWRKELKGLGDVTHSKYRNRVIVTIESERIVVRSIETYGAYVECLAQDDGRQLHHRLVEIPKGR